jgi:hypothetical protein
LQNKILRHSFCKSFIYQAITGILQELMNNPGCRIMFILKGGIQVENEMECGETKNILRLLAEEISDMTEEERLLCLERIVQAELGGNRNRFWTTISKKMLVSPELSDKILSDTQFLQTI